MIEVLVALVILSVIVVTFSRLFIGSYQTVGWMGDRSQDLAQVQTVMEEVLVFGFDEENDGDIYSEEFDITYVEYPHNEGFIRFSTNGNVVTRPANKIVINHESEQRTISVRAYLPN
ncbi:hypothetical protein BHF68_01240 [Desulfuribacillus alkaliarsenatis]|uniref:Uncharacterized protein n=1 Tax=Desulfuribacillus alkaliarsenatis TaxID=766136 RepID=A0A1E5G597_9FIRM|nr:hypothetical protein BHF68_01240 [Desulfuribacillus alkaliarsenatis]